MLLLIYLLVWKMNTDIFVRNVLQGFEYNLKDNDNIAISELNKTMIYLHLESFGKELITYNCDCFMNTPRKINTLKYLHSCFCPKIEISTSIMNTINDELKDGGTLIVGIEE